MEVVGAPHRFTDDSGRFQPQDEPLYPHPTAL
jgi:hypothetical protein